MAEYVLGLDLGSNSVGWAMIAPEGEVFDNELLILANQRVFPAGLENEKDKEGRATGQGVPPGQVRRQKRSERRQHWRRRQRRKRLSSILMGAGLLPQDSVELSGLFATNLYPLRARGLDEQLTLYEFGRVLYHLCQRRGFKSNRKQEKSKEDGKVAEETAELQSKIDSAGCRTLGEYLAKLDGDFQHIDTESDHIRNRYTLRVMYENEFAMLWDAQAAFHPDTLTDNLKKEVRHAIFDQRRVWWPANTIGKCELTGEPRCPKAHWLGQQFRLLQEINNLKVVDLETGEEGFVNQDERERLREILMPVKQLSFAKIAKKLWPKKKMKFRTFEESAQRKGLLGNAVEAAMRSGALASWYETLSTEQRDNLYDALVETEIVEVAGKNRCYGPDPEELRRKGTEEWGLSAEQSEELVEVEESLPSDYFKYSISAIRKLLPHLEKGLTVDKAIVEADLSLLERKVYESLPPINKIAPYLTNPLVHRALSETRKVVNAIIRQYGKPAEIVIELAREMKKSRPHRQRILKQNKQNEKGNEEAKEEIEKAGLNPESWNNRTKYKLWKEWRDICSEPAQCPYCGENICESKLFSEDFEIDHILPKSRSLDNSFNNLTLCCTQCNREKGNQTPCEAWGDNQDRWGKIHQRINGFHKDRWSKRKNANEGKYLRFVNELEGDNLFENCADRLLKATQYTATQAVDYLKTLYDDPDGKVRCVSGGMTYELRRLWELNGLNGIEGPADKKNRTDHRHHAIDAIVIALTTAKHIHNLSNYYREKDERRAKEPPRMPLPRKGFRDDVQRVIDEIGEGKEIGVSHRPTQKVAGQLHDETGYGPVKDKDGKQIENVYVRRKNVADLTPAVINDDDAICDKTIRNIIRAECVKRGLAEEVKEGAKKSWELNGHYYTVKAKPGKTLSDPPPKLECTKKDPGKFIPIKRVRIRVVSGKAECVHHEGKYIFPEGNHHFEIYQNSDGTWTGDLVDYMRVHKRLAAQKRQNKGKSKKEDWIDLVINPEHKPGLKMVLHRNDMVQLTDPEDGIRKLYRVQKMSYNPEKDTPYVVFRLHTAAKIDDDSSMVRIVSWNRSKERRSWKDCEPTKVTVDPLGRVDPCND